MRKRSFKNSKNWNKILYFFPIQLLILNLRKNQILLLFWLIIFAITLESVGKGLGIPTLFLDPEYNGNNGFVSFALLGLSLAGFTMAFNIANYILDSYRFNFLGFIRRPFTHFCINNSIIPIAYLITYTLSVIAFQKDQNIYWLEIVTKLLGFYFGFFLTIYLIILYFGITNKDYFKHFVDEVDRNLKKTPLTRQNILRRLNSVRKGNVVKINSYIRIPFRFSLVKPTKRFDREALIHIFDQNHLNAVLFEIISFLLFLSIGLFKDYPIFQIPAASSAMLLGTIIIMFIGAFTYWLRSWALTFLVILFILLNTFVQFGFLQKQNFALGMDYQKPPVNYNMESIQKMNTDSIYTRDSLYTIQTLNNWKNKFNGPEKPRMVFIATSGGGQRAAVWTLRTLQYADSATGGKLMQQTQLITGASGGMIGASYFRELYYRAQHNDISHSYWSNRYVDKISMDNLNPIIFSMVVSDLFLRVQKTEFEGMYYYKDRGYALEDKLNQNTDFVMNKKLMDYKYPEVSAEIPMIIMSPALINDGRKLYISPQPISYMNRAGPDFMEDETPIMKGVEFMRFFENHGAQNLPMLTALRMNATFPYITPNIDLPSNPVMEIMDSGISDNFGTSDAVRFLFVFRDWIKENTSGIIFVRIRDTERIKQVEEKQTPSIISKFFNPISSIYTIWGAIQEIKNDNYIEYAEEWIDKPIDVIDFEYDPKVYYFPEEPKPDITWKRAALSWHLTAKEKRSINNAIYAPVNQDALLELQQLLNK